MVLILLTQTFPVIHSPLINLEKLPHCSRDICVFHADLGLIGYDMPQKQICWYFQIAVDNPVQKYLHGSRIASLKGRKTTEEQNSLFQSYNHSC